MSHSLAVTPSIILVAAPGYEDDLAGLMRRIFGEKAVNISTIAWGDHIQMPTSSDIIFAHDVLDPKLRDIPSIIAALRDKIYSQKIPMIIHNTRHSAVPLEIVEAGNVIVISSMMSLKTALVLLGK